MEPRLSGVEQGRVIGGLANRWLRMGIATKLFVGYGLVASLVFVIAVASLAVLERINQINASILRVNIPLVESSGRMIDALLDQENYARRALILKSDEMGRLFAARSADFDRDLAVIGQLPGVGGVSLERTRKLHAEYSERFLRLLAQPQSPSALEEDREQGAIRLIQEELIGILKEVSTRARRDQYAKTTESAQMGDRAVKAMGAICLVGLLLCILLTLMLHRGIARPLMALTTATRRVADGQFDEFPRIGNRDELGDLAGAFSEMIVRLRRLEEMNLDASPLTRLPGNVVIENVLRKRLEGGAPLAFCLVDMDNFKAYNDRYGYARGSALIKELGAIIGQAVACRGNPADFVGHIGGDDFVVLTAPDHFRDICNEIIRLFDGKVPSFYDPADVQQGYILSKSRQGARMRFPLITVSIAVVTNTERPLTGTVQVGELAAELKEYAKSLEGSVFVVDRRRKDEAATTDV